MKFQLIKSESIGDKLGHAYFKDPYGTIFCDPIDQSNMVGGGHEEGRNTLENPTRLERVKALLPEGSYVLDYGCGNGMFVSFLADNGIKVVGYDKFHITFPMENAMLFASGKLDLITCIEVVEHFHEPFEEIQQMFDILNPGGKVMFETSFSNWLTLEDEYINPLAGHHCVHSHEGLTALMVAFGFIEGEHINRNVRIYIKP